jgi:hypothetical protein
MGYPNHIYYKLNLYPKHKHNRSLKVAVQGPALWPTLIHIYIQNTAHHLNDKKVVFHPFNVR